MAEAVGSISSGNSWIISFGPFRVNRALRLLERDGQPVRIGSRAFDILVHLLEHHGQVVSHQALLEAAWPKIIVEEGSLRFQLTSLRKALGNGQPDHSYITNVLGRDIVLPRQFQRLARPRSLDNRPLSLSVALTRYLDPPSSLVAREIFGIFQILLCRSVW